MRYVVKRRIIRDTLGGLKLPSDIRMAGSALAQIMRMTQWMM